MTDLIKKIRGMLPENGSKRTSLDYLDEVKQLDLKNQDAYLALKRAFEENERLKAEERARNIDDSSLDSKLDRPEEYTAPDPIELHNLFTYDAEGRPFKHYRKATLAGEAEKDSKGNYLRKNQNNWIKYFKEQGKEMPDFPLFYAIVERMQETSHPGKDNLLKELRASWLCLATRFDYKNNKITHGYGFSPEEFSCTFPYGNNYLDEVKSQKKWRSALQALLMPKDLDKAIQTLSNFAGVRPYIWTPDKDGRKSYPERAAFVGAYSVRLYLYCGGHPDDVDDHGRWVVKE